MSGVETILISVFAAVIYSMSMYIKKNLKSDNPQDFEVTKFLATVIVGAVVGVVMWQANVPITEESFEIV